MLPEEILADLTARVSGLLSRNRIFPARALAGQSDRHFAASCEIAVFPVGRVRALRPAFRDFRPETGFFPQEYLPFRITGISRGNAKSRFFIGVDAGWTGRLETGFCVALLRLNDRFFWGQI